MPQQPTATGNDTGRSAKSSQITLLNDPKWAAFLWRCGTDAPLDHDDFSLPQTAVPTRKSVFPLRQRTGAFAGSK
jgi:hypothetical protein